MAGNVPKTENEELIRQVMALEKELKQLKYEDLNTERNIKKLA